MSYPDFQKLYKNITEKNRERAHQAIAIARKNGLKTEWYAFWKSPRTLWEKYDYSYWLNFHIYNDLRQWAKSYGNHSLVDLKDRSNLLFR